VVGKKIGYPGIVDILLEKYKENGIIAQENGMPTTTILVPGDRSSRYCDVCIFNISD
jgi:hypothetical protein